MSTPISVKSFTLDGPNLFDSNLFDRWQISSGRGGRLIRGRLRADLRADDPAVREFLRRWPGAHAVRARPDGLDLLLFEPEGRFRPRWWLHGLLFGLTGVSVALAGGLLAGGEPLVLRAPPLRLWVDWGAWASGLPFAAVLLLILLAHEMGHYAAARLHRLEVTPPFFIPFPAYLSIVGTLGAFIRLRSPLLGRRPLLDVGVAGPLAGFVVSAGAALYGLLESALWPIGGSPPAPYLLHFLGIEVWVGGSLLFDATAAAVFGPARNLGPVALSPLACAGWFGLFVTALNLLPVGQLDGGHILYALEPRAQRWVSRAAFLALVPLGWAWPGWWVWAALVFVVGRGRLSHPPVVDPDTPLDGVRAALAWAAIVVFALTFVPRPFVF